MNEIIHRIFHVPCFVLVTIVAHFARFMLFLHDFWETSAIAREIKFFFAKVFPNLVRAFIAIALASPVFVAIMIFLVKWSS